MLIRWLTRTSYSTVPICSLLSSTSESFENEPKSPLLMTTNAVHLTTTPSPDSQSTTTEFGDAFVQTSVDYDESVKLMVDELVECSIYVAQKTLDEEERQNANRTQMEKLQSELERKDEINSELREKLETSKKQIEETRKENEKVLNTRIADVLVEDLVEEATRRMDEGQLRAISDQRSLCDSAVDTRDFIRQELRNKVVLSELEKDFFPWLYGKVKNMVDHCFAASYLDDAFLCEEAEIKQNSKTALIGKLREV
ncbi:hypothetical protein AB6A40_005635 [Gnathostoma spinigerum]|uniref:Uncharacterized protein n=1 Tax=Gnathostoma spinigerum TaxID=75299 RepID=A0ABD6ENB5_9BILA